MLFLLVLFITIIQTNRIYYPNEITCINGDACDSNVTSFTCNQTFCEYYAEHLRVENLVITCKNRICNASYNLWKTKDDDRLNPLKEVCIMMKVFPGIKSKLRSANEEECFMHRLCDFVKDISSEDLNGGILLLQKENPYTKYVEYKSFINVDLVFNKY